ncbi:MAG TPA: hypothetical protein ENI27_02525, partial [bacterium]|nr:hypothetical protein [bacterium]
MSNDASGTMIGDGHPSIIVRQTQEQFPIAFLNTPLLLAWSLLGSFLTLCQVQAAGLEFIFIPTPGAEKTESRLRKNSSMAERYLPYSIDSLQLIDFVARTEGIGTIEIRFEPNLHFSSQLERHSLFSDNFKLVLETDEGTQNIAPHLAQTYQGVIIDDRGSSVRLTIAANYFAGFIKTGDGDIYFIEMEVPSSPLPGADLAVRLYQPELGVGSGQGRVEDFSSVPAWYPQTDESQTTAEYSDTSIYEAEIALIADYAAYAKVNSISLLANEILNILNYTDAYYSQLNIAYRLVEIAIFTSPEAETWPETMDAGELLSA